MMMTYPTSGGDAKRYNRIRCWSLAIVAGAAIVAAVVAGCGERSILSAPTGQKIVTWAEPYDRDALMAAMPYYIADDLSGYDFGVLIAVQNRLSKGFKVTLEVNGQDIERRYVGAETQEIFAVTNDMIRQTEQITGVSSEAIPFLAQRTGRPHPFVVRLKNYVCEDDHVIQSTNFLLAPVNQFETKVGDDQADDGRRLDLQYVCPASFAVVVDVTHIRAFELDREWAPVYNEDPDSTQGNEAEDDPDYGVDGSGYEDADPAQYLPEEVNVLTGLGLTWLLQAPWELATFEAGGGI